jgi:hypothetical protein
VLPTDEQTPTHQTTIIDKQQVSALTEWRRIDVDTIHPMTRPNHRQD